MGGVVASYPLLSQAPTPVEVELGCDNCMGKSKSQFDTEEDLLVLS